MPLQQGTLALLGTKTCAQREHLTQQATPTNIEFRRLHSVMVAGTGLKHTLKRPEEQSRFCEHRRSSGYDAAASAIYCRLFFSPAKSTKESHLCRIYQNLYLVADAASEVACFAAPRKRRCDGFIRISPIIIMLSKFQILL